MLPPIEQALYIFSKLTPLDWSAQELNWMLSHVPYSRYIYPSWRGAFHEPILALEPTERCKIPTATRRLEAILLTDFRDGPGGLHPKIREFDELLLNDSKEDGRIPLQYVAEDDDFGPSIPSAVRPVLPEHQVARLLLFMSELSGPKPTAKWKRAADLRISEQPEALGGLPKPYSAWLPSAGLRQTWAKFHVLPPRTLGRSCEPPSGSLRSSTMLQHIFSSFETHPPTWGQATTARTEFAAPQYRPTPAWRRSWRLPRTTRPSQLKSLEHSRTSGTWSRTRTCTNAWSTSSTNCPQSEASLRRNYWKQLFPIWAWMPAV